MTFIKYTKPQFQKPTLAAYDVRRGYGISPACFCHTGFLRALLIAVLMLWLSFGLNPAMAQNVDLRLLNAINGPVDPSADRAWRLVTNSSPFIDGAVPLTMFITGIIRHDENLKIKAWETGASVLIAGGSAFVLKNILKRNRPFVSHADIITIKAADRDYAFPSGHTALAFAAATSLSLSFPKWYVIAPSFVYAGAVSYSRLYLGVHYPSDVLAGALTGAASSFISFKVNHWLQRHKTTRH